jgi:hypothetical protein
MELMFKARRELLRVLEAEDRAIVRRHAGRRAPWRGASNPTVQLLSERIVRAFELLPVEARARYAEKLVNAKGTLAKHAVLRLDYQWISLYVAA